MQNILKLRYKVIVYRILDQKGVVVYSKYKPQPKIQAETWEFSTS